MRGKFITFEGIDGAGKSTHIGWIADRIRATGKNATLTREPGGTLLGEKLRELLLHQPMHAETEAMLMFAARREHIHQVIQPALGRGDWVVSDRFTDSSFAYQGGGRGVATEKLRALEQWVQGSLQPDLTFLFDVPVSVARDRLNRNTPSPDRFEQEREGFFTRVRDAYLLRAQESPTRFCVINSTLSIKEVNDQLSTALS
ncbi:MAG: dTMP kinase, partial [Burkholderiales bacterium]